MAAQNLRKNAFGCTVAAALALATGAFSMLGTRRRRLDELHLRIAELEERAHRDTQLVQQQRQQFDLLSKAIDDPDLAAVFSTVENVDPVRRRQYLFANAMYTNALLAYRVGVVNREELYGHLRVVCQNAIFRDYWEATRHHRASLPNASEEAGVGHMVDSLIRDLEETDSEEWWLVGEPPGE